MSSSLAAQLAQHASLNASLLVDRSKRKPTASYLFTGKSADDHDLEAIRALAVNSLISLSSIEPRLSSRNFEDVLFSEGAKDTDRTLLTPKRVKEVDECLEEFLALLGPYLMQPVVTRVLEWLVRRFRIHEFNVEAVIALFLPYHESPHFAKMVTLLHIKPNTVFSFLLPYKSAALPLPRSSLVTEMLKNSDLARFVLSLLPNALKKKKKTRPQVHRTLVVFNAAVLGEFIRRCEISSGRGDSGRKRKGVLDEGTLGMLLQALVEPLMKEGMGRDVVLGSYILLASLSQKCKRSISASALKMIISAIVSSALSVSVSDLVPCEQDEQLAQSSTQMDQGSKSTSNIRADQVVKTLVAVCEPQEELEGALETGILKAILAIQGIEQALIDALPWEGSEKILNPFIRGVVASLTDTQAQTILESLISATNTKVSPTIADTLTGKLVNVVVDDDDVERDEVEAGMDIGSEAQGEGRNEGGLAAGEASKKKQGETCSVFIAHRLLGLIYQRYPESLRRVGEVLAQDDESKAEAFEQLIIGLSSVKLPASSSSSRRRKSKKGGSVEEEVDIIISASAAEPKVRVKAVRELVRLVRMEGGRDDMEDIETIRSTLMARIQDSELGVLEVLYDEGTAPTLAGLFVRDVKGYVASLALALAVVKQSQSEKKTKVKMKRNVLRLHLTFLVNHMWGLLREDEAEYKQGDEEQDKKENKKGRELVFHEVIFPLLLFTKGRQKNVEVVWEILAALDSKGGGVGEGLAWRWLEGCGGVVKAEGGVGGMGRREEGKEAEVGWMNMINFGVAGRIAENIISSKTEHFALDLDMLVLKMRDENVYVKLLAYVVVLVLLRKVKGERKVEVAEKTLCTLWLADGENGIEGVNDLSQEYLALEKEDDISFAKYIITKPQSKTSLKWMRTAVLASIARIPLPVQGEELNWMLESAKCTTNLGQRYIRLMRSIYEIANAPSSLPVVSSTILQLLFRSLKDNSLAFLSGIWASNFHKSNSANSHVASGSASNCARDGLKNSRTISLFHAAAFLEAHVLEEDGMDFQTVLPSLVVGLLSTATGGLEGEDVGVDGGQMQMRTGVFECLSRVRVLVERVLRKVYKFDVIYGEGEKTLQYLDRNDLKRYLTALVEHRDHLINDPSYLIILHEHHLGRMKGEKKKEAEYKHRVTCFLLSHANAFLSESGQMAILKSLVRVQDQAKCEIMLPTIQALLSRVSDVDVTLVASEELMVQLVACFDATSAGVLNNDENIWEVFLHVVRTYLRSGTPLAIQKAVCCALSGGLFAALSGQRQVALCTVLLEVGSNDAISQSCARTLLSDILNDVPLIVQLLDALAPAVPTSSPRTAKRVKIVESTEDPLPRLSILVEILGTKALPGSLDLTSRLLDTLNRVIQNLPATQADVVYTSQLLMSAIESTSSKIVEVPNITPSVIRIDVLVEVMRVSGNPQTFHQALLLVSSLARLAPDSVLFHIMPVFTFMGSTVFHRDDSYSFKVVQQTIDGIVPVMVSSLRESHSQPLELYRAAKEFLRVFTDAAAHIPRHRRNYFFSHLVEVLGSRDFLPPICMLLLERSANRVVRQSFEEVKTTLALPITLFQQASYELQIHAATELLNEAQRLIAHVVDSNSAQEIFMECIPDGDHSVSRATILRRRAQALIIFVGLVVKPKKTSTPSVPLQDGDVISTVITQLIALAHRSTSEIRLDDISEAARSSLNRLLISMSVTDFMESVQTILSSGDTKIESGALEVLGKRLPDVSAKMRPAISVGIKKILLSIKNFLHIHRKGAGVIFAFEALKSVAMTLCPGEEGPLADVVPYLLSAMDEKELTSPSLATLASISAKLGPRVIPFFRPIISRCTTVLQGSDSALFENAISTLQGLLKTIPAFWGNGELSQIIFLYMNQFSFTSSPLAPVQTLTKSLAKKIPPRTLLSTLIEIWSPLQSSATLTRISAFFEVLGRSLQHADRPTVLDHLRELFKIFLDALDIVKADEKAEQPVICAFREMVVKLNESAFKPLFRRLHDWAFIGEPNTERRVIFGRLYVNLLDFFKGLMVPYISFLLQTLIGILKSFKTSKNSDPLLWFCIIGIFTRALSYDENAFWRDDKLRQIQDGLTSQIQVCMRLNHIEGRKQLQDCLAALLDSITDDTLLKTVNLNVLMHTRSEDSRVRIFALSCAEVLWRSHGGRLLGFARETATFIAECGEDDNELVVKAAFNLKDAVESVAGKINGL